MSETISVLPQPQFRTSSLRAVVRSWRAELVPFPNRWRRAARVAFVTAVGAALMATLQIANPLGLTLLVSLAAPEFAFTLATAVTFLIAAAIIQVLSLFVVGALADSPILLVVGFATFSAVTTYLIYGVRRLGRLWLWIQIPAVTAFYMVQFDHRALGWDNAQMYAGTAMAVGLLWLFNEVIWPMPAEAVLANSLHGALERSRSRLNELIATFLGGLAPEHDRGVASKLGYHLALLRPATRESEVRGSANLLAAVMVAERIHNEIERLSLETYRQEGARYDDTRKNEVRLMEEALSLALSEYLTHINQPTDREHLKMSPALQLFDARAHRLRELGAMDQVGQRLVRIADLLRADPRELPHRSGREGRSPIPRQPFRPNKFLVRFCVRHTVAMTLAFIAGLFDNSPAIRAALWLLMIGGPPSHGATARKFTMRAIGSSGALAFAAIATIVVAPNFTSIPNYLAAIFVGVMLMTYIGEGGGELSYLSIGATAFVIAFSGPGPRPEMVGSIWTIWGISLGMIIRAIVSAVSIERPNRTLAEEIERPLDGLAALASAIDRKLAERAAADVEVIAGIKEMLDVAADAQLQGPSSGIDSCNLVDALDTMRRLAFSIANLRPSSDPVADAFDDAVRARTKAWLAGIHLQLQSGQLSDAPLRTMLADPAGSEISAALQAEMAPDPDRRHLAGLILRMEQQLAGVRLP